MPKILCPSCGHHLFNTSEPPKEVDPTTEEPVRDALPAVAEFMTRVAPGRYLPVELHARFERESGMPVTSRAFGLALRALGYQRRSSGGRRHWVIE